MTIPAIPGSHRDLLDVDFLSLATKTRDGQIQVTYVAFLFDPADGLLPPRAQNMARTFTTVTNLGRPAQSPHCVQCGSSPIPRFSAITEIGAPVVRHAL